MRYPLVVVAIVAAAWPGFAAMRAGVATVSITPLEENIPTQLGGYGDRAGKPAEGIHDTIHAKALLFDDNGVKSALITVDTCSIPLGAVETALARAAIEGLTIDRTLAAASHTHAGLEGFALDRRNTAGNPHIGVFSEEMFQFVTGRIAQALTEANAALQPVTAGAGRITVRGMNRNRRGDNPLDQDVTVLRLDRADGAPWVVFVNYTAHGTIMSPGEMLISGGWPGVMQRTVEAVLGEGVTCMYANGAEGDITHAGSKGGSNWERAEDYGRRIGLRAAALARSIDTAAVEDFTVQSQWVDLPPRKAAPEFVQIAGTEYHITEEQLHQMLPVLFPDKAPLYALRVNDFAMISFPGEPICEIGLGVKKALAAGGIAYPCVAGLTTDYIGYILTPVEYRESGYEATASFYGETLGEIMLTQAVELAREAAKQ
ncbi:MAG TPA: neutral/alkaline non-lysosomal ceramidase N-terminal domain-containing protein [Candidatus Hydrogenedentes bacterium]|nr:neutral/alkaline non-lysosomal ceramidase N-terminal domain-containing protein [Candidatus Hydrogenedentota bacterium]HNZ19706.1 neutral/alkaline non-lysosomal ceramidase N-terminal domain-containing protein [Candidatus Hydrogenedentota bacterium]HOH35172.1 neutral/alkaline non-lysosomal ceramidase N-terminal domain-containing protein [Candidatus Hydrogenedentota bacterium]HPA04112.1 neutral/alkaline non-lysosomal ceramidase N-terminal domain-containing protein [Candidatus Hydrogenedentota ba